MDRNSQEILWYTHGTVVKIDNKNIQKLIESCEDEKEVFFKTILAVIKNFEVLEL